MRIECPQCRRTEIFAPYSDVILGYPRCKKCGITMQVVGKVTLLDWVKRPTKLIHKFFN